MSDTFMKICNQKFLAGSLLENMWRTDPKAIVGGGAARDWWMDNVANDIDLYFRAPNHNTITKAQTLIESWGVENVKVLSSTDANYIAMSQLKWVFEANIGEQKLNFIIMQDDTIYELWKYFSCSICEIAFSLGGFEMSENFKLALDKKLVIINNGFNVYDKHIEKMMDRFPDYRFLKDVRDSSSDASFEF